MSIHKLITPDKTEDIHMRFTIAYGVFGSIILYIYSAVNFAIGDYLPAFFELALGFFAMFLVIISLKSGKLEWGKFLGFIPIFAISIHNFINGGFENTGVLWTYVLPLIVIFLSGKRIGLVVNLLYLAAIGICFYLASRNIYFVERYEAIFFWTYIISYFSVVTLALLFQWAWDRALSFVTVQKENEQEIKKQLQLKVVELERTKAQLEKTLTRSEKVNAQLTRVNGIMVNRELKMIELKKKVEMLQGNAGE